MIRLDSNAQLPDFDLSLSLALKDSHQIHGTYPNAMAVSPDQTRLYVAEAGLNSVAVLGVSRPLSPKLLRRIGARWYPTAVAVSPGHRTLYCANPHATGQQRTPPTGTSPGAQPLPRNPHLS